jgi:predicted Zn-ribbon and HTH transcriptional regulator
VELLSRQEFSFEELRRELQLPVRALEEDLRHVERSLRRSDRRLVVKPPRCQGCGFEFRGRAPRRFAAPGRCPRCRSERIHPAWLRIEKGP